MLKSLSAKVFYFAGTRKHLCNWNNIFNLFNIHQFINLPVLISIAFMSPLPLTSVMTDPFMSRSLSLMSLPMTKEFCERFSSSKTWRPAIATLEPRGFPPKVDPWVPVNKNINEWIKEQKRFLYWKSGYTWSDFNPFIQRISDFWNLFLVLLNFVWISSFLLETRWKQLIISLVFTVYWKL